MLSLLLEVVRDMASDSGYAEKLDALDLIINALKDHEKRLDELSHHLESICQGLSIKETEAREKEESRIEPPQARKAPFVVCNKWNEFMHLSKGAKIVTYEIEGTSFYVYSMVDENVFRYSEDLPDKRLKVLEEESCFSIDKTSLSKIDLLQILIQGKLECGLHLIVKSLSTTPSGKHILLELSYDFDPDEVKDFLARELGISKSNVVEGKITC